MNKCKLKLLLILIITFTLTSCGGVSIKKPATPVKNVAIASFSVSDWGGSVKRGSIGRKSLDEIINERLVKLIYSTENSLSKRFKVKKVSQFITNREYHKLASKKILSVYTPKIKGKSMPVFTTVSRDIKGGMINPETAKKLCKTLKVDAIVLVFSEWTSRTGGLVHMTKAVTKNVFTMWDRDGNLIARRRIDKMGRKPLGSFGVKAVNEDTLTEWGTTSRKSLDEIISSKAIAGLAG